MKNKTRDYIMKSNFKLLATVAISILSISLYATITPPPTPQDVPLDGGMLVLLSAAAGYAANKMKKGKAEEVSE
ncbi:MAG: PID-CTERM protein-sorting domain-containing protein [Flavobacteriales bacterium]